MIRIFFLLVILNLLQPLVMLAQPDSTIALPDTSHLKTSLITCGPGLQPWETFGHTAIRIVDSNRGTDNVYNYGTFNGYDEDFLLNFTRGKLLYYLSYYPYRQFLLEYSEAERSVSEQEILLSGPAKQALYEYLNWNAREENRYYKYDFFYDNCATRIRDVFPRALGNKFVLGKVIADNSEITFRQIINQYFYRVHWQRFGVNILLGSKIDKVMTSAEIMFLPDYLQQGILKASYKQNPVSFLPVAVLPSNPPVPAGINGPFVVMLMVLVLTFAGLFVSRLKMLGSVMSFSILILSGLIGWFIMVMWLGTDHQTCRNNFNLLWALPTNVILAFTMWKNKSKYALMGILFIFISLLLHLLGMQELPLFEISPFLLALLLVYGMIYRKSKLKAS